MNYRRAMAQVITVTRGLPADRQEPSAGSRMSASASALIDKVGRVFASIGGALGSWSVSLMETLADGASTVRASLLVYAQFRPSPAVDLNRSLLSAAFPLMLFDAVGTTVSGGAALLRSIKNGDTAGVIDALIQIPSGMVKFVTGGIFVIIAPVSAAVDIMQITQTACAQLTRILNQLWIVASVISALYFAIKVGLSSYRAVLCLKMLFDWKNSEGDGTAFLSQQLRAEAADVQTFLDKAGDQDAQKALLLERGCASVIKRFKATATGANRKEQIAKLEDLLAKLVRGELQDDDAQTLQTFFDRTQMGSLAKLKDELKQEGANEALVDGFQGLCEGNPILLVGLAEVALQVQGDKNARLDRVVGTKQRKIAQAELQKGDLAKVNSALKKGLAIKLTINAAVVVAAIIATAAMIGSIVTLGPNALLALAIMMVIYNVIFMAADGASMYLTMEGKPTKVDKALVYVSMGLAITLMLTATILSFTIGLPLSALMVTSITFSLWMTFDMMILKWMAKQEKLAAEKEQQVPDLDKLIKASQCATPVTL